MTICRHASFCGKRMALGNREHGCNHVDEANCSPVMSVRNPTPTAPAGPGDQPYRKCSTCYRRVTRREWERGGANMLCQCGSMSWVKP